VRSPRDELFTVLGMDVCLGGHAPEAAMPTMIRDRSAFELSLDAAGGIVPLSPAK
jgi:hypothetical protein